jgi:leucyl aminopeptidase (aminopeptidase T)
LETVYDCSPLKKIASAAGARIASMPNITLEMMKRILVADPSSMRADSAKIAALLTGEDNVTITSAQGTNISLSICGRTAFPTGVII